MNFLRRSLYLQMVITFIVSIVSVAIVATYLLWYESGVNARARQLERTVQRIVAAVELIEDEKTLLARPHRLRLMSKPNFHLQLRNAPQVFPLVNTDKQLSQQYISAIEAILTQDRTITAMVTPLEKGPEADIPEPDRALLSVNLSLNNGHWLAIQTVLDSHRPPIPWHLWLVLAVILLAVCLTTLIIVRWVTRPLAELAHAAENLAKDIDAKPLKEEGAQEISAAATAFNHMQAQIQKMLAEKGEFFAAVSHDLKTPLTRLRLRTEMLTDNQLAEKFNVDLREMEALIEVALDSLQASTAEAKQKLELQAFLQALVDDYQEVQRPVALIKSEVVIIKGQCLALKRCLQNIIENGLRYGSEVELTLTQDDKQAIISCQDKGPGIPLEEHEKVFQPFYRMEPSRNQASGGHGLGLTIVDKVVKAHGGSIVIDNTVEQGCCLIIKLPTDLLHAAE